MERATVSAPEAPASEGPEIGLLRSVVDQAETGFIAVDRRGRVVLWNRWMAETSGIPAAAALGRDLDDLFGRQLPPRLGSAIRDALDHQLASAVTPRFNPVLLPLTRSDASGTIIPIDQLLAVKPIHANGQVFCLIQVRDETAATRREQFLRQQAAQLRASNAETERQRAELAAMVDTLARARAEAEAANKAKSAFLAVMSHELRTPLNAILGFSEMIRDQALGRDAIDKYSEYARDVYNSGKYLLDLIGDILDIAKIEAGKLELAPDWIDLRHLLSSICSLVREQAANRGLLIDFDRNNLPPKLFADERAMKKILYNLISNAIKFTKPGGSITLRALQAEDDAIEIAVIDTGIGIPPEQIDRLLRPFEQIDNRYRHSEGGTGLGLSVVTALADLHGGGVSIASTVGVGTTITVRLPQAVEDQAVLQA